MAYSESERKDHVLPPQEPGSEGQVKKMDGNGVLGGTSPVYYKFTNGKWEPAKKSDYLQSSPNIVNYKVLPDLGMKGAEAAANYRYPDDIAVGFNTDYVMFEFYKYQPPFQGVNRDATRQGSSPVRAYNQTAEDAKFYTSVKSGPVILYMPEDISTGYKANWSGKAFSNIAADALATAGSKDINEGIQNTLAAANTAINQAIPNAMNFAIRKTISKITGESVSANDLFAATRGVILNPNVELLFQGTDLRNFQLNYKLFPRNPT